jgi:hypothetical protein
VLRLGAVLVPVSMREAGPACAFILNQCRASLVIADVVMTALMPPCLDDGEPLRRVACPARTRAKAGCRGRSLLACDPGGFADAQPSEGRRRGDPVQPPAPPASPRARCSRT